MNTHPHPGSILIDIDGTILYHETDFLDSLDVTSARGLVGSAEKIAEWACKGYNIVLTTGRNESMREVTIAQLKRAKIVYDEIIFGLGPGPRYLINDLSPEFPDQPKATAINVRRNMGIKDVIL